MAERAAKMSAHEDVDEAVSCGWLVVSDGGRSKYFDGEADDCGLRALAHWSGEDYKELGERMLAPMNKHLAALDKPQIVSYDVALDAAATSLTFREMFDLRQLAFENYPLPDELANDVMLSSDGKLGDVALVDVLPSVPMMLVVRKRYEGLVALRPGVLVYKSREQHMSYWSGEVLVDLFYPYSFDELVCAYYAPEYQSRMLQWKDAVESAGLSAIGCGSARAPELAG